MTIQSDAADRRRANRLLEEWKDDQRPALQRMLAAAETLADAMDEYRGTLLMADEVTEHDLQAVDTLGGILDHRDNAVGSARKRLDEHGMKPELISLDTLELFQAHAKAKARADARRTIRRVA